jgi:hypothetical protein
VAVAEASDEETAVAHDLVAVAPDETPVAAEVPAPDAPPVVRPRPIEPRYPVGSGGVYGTGRDDGIGGGGVTVVIRGGRTGRDPCLPGERRGGRRGDDLGVIGTIISINNRVPGRGTFPRY